MPINRPKTLSREELEALEDKKEEIYAQGIKDGLNADQRLELYREEVAKAKGIKYRPRRPAIGHTIQPSKPSEEDEAEDALSERGHGTGRAKQATKNAKNAKNAKK